MLGLVRYFLDRSLFVNLLTFLILAMGGYFAATMNREAFPNIDFDLVAVTTIYPGASPREVEKLVTNPIEEMIKEVDGIEEYRSTSLESRSQLVIKIDPDVEDTSKVVDDIRSAIDRVQDIPDDAEETQIQEVSTSRQPVIDWSIGIREDAEGRPLISYAELREFARIVENEFLRHDGVARISRKGWRQAEIFVDVSPEKLTQYQISTGSIINTLRDRNVNLPGGEIEQRDREVVVRTIGEFQSVAEIAQVPLRSNDIGQSVRVGDVARVYEDFEEPTILETSLGLEAINLTIVKRESADIISTVNDSKRIMMDLTPHVVEIRTTQPGLSASEVHKLITNPILIYARQTLMSEGPGPFGLGAPLISSVEYADAPGQSIVTLTLNPARVPDDRLDDRDVVFRELFAELQERLEDRHEDLVPTEASPFDYKMRVLPDGIVVSDLNDVSFFVRRRLGVLSANGIAGLILVVLALFLFMGWRTSIMVTLGIPVALGMTFIAMNFLGVTLNLISMFGLIMVIGIVVDDAIIVSENIYRYLEEGQDPYTAAGKGTAEVIPPVVATISTTIAAFGPMMFMSGIFGKFVFTIPLVVILALISSLLECILILPSHVYDMNRNMNFAEQGGAALEKGAKRSILRRIGDALEWFRLYMEGVFDQIRSKLYLPSLRFALNRPWKVLGALVALFIFALGVQGAFGRFKLFPGAVENVHVKITLPTGVTKFVTQRYIDAFEHEVAKLDDTILKNYSSRAGIIQKPGGNDPQTRRGSSYGQVMIYLTSELDRDVTSEQITLRLRNRTEYLLSESELQRKRKNDEQGVRTYIRNDRPELLEEYGITEDISTLEAALDEIEEKEDELHSGGVEWYEFWKETPEPIEELSDEEIAARVPGIMDRFANMDFEVPARYAALRGGITGFEMEELQGGPPVGKPIAVEITGDDFDTMLEVAEEYKTAMRRVDGVVDIDDSFLEGQDEKRLQINESLASTAGVTVRQIALAVNASFEGIEATSIRRAEEEVDIRVRFADRFRNDLDSLNKIYVTNNVGSLVPVSRLSGWVNAEGITSISHLDGRRLVTVFANVQEEVVTSQEATASIQAFTQDVPGRYPGYQIRYGGENKDTEESLASLGRAFAVGVIVIFMILASLFRSLVQPAVVLTAVPFSMIGVIFAFVLHGMPFSFLALMGIIGLSGVVINDSIVLVDFANRIRDENPELGPDEVVSRAGALRLRPVILTTLTTVAGLLPTAYGIGGHDPFLVPMAMSFAWGLAFSTFLILVIVPILYMLFERLRSGIRTITTDEDSVSDEISG